MTPPAPCIGSAMNIETVSGVASIVPPLRGGRPRIPQGRHHPPVPGGGSVLLRPGVRLRAGGRASVRGDPQPAGLAGVVAYIVTVKNDQEFPTQGSGRAVRTRAEPL